MMDQRVDIPCQVCSVTSTKGEIVGMALGAALTCFVFIEIIKTELIKEI